MTLLYRIALLLFLFPTFALAQLPGQLLEDFAPADGVVLMAMGDYWLVDLDANQNLHPGDILSVMSPGETIVHPETRDIIGRTDHVVGFLEVSRVMSGYSYVVPLTKDLPLATGIQVRRFEQVPALLDAGITPDLASLLKRSLPHLQWTDAVEQNNSVVLRFSIDFERLVISTAEGVNIRAYRYQDGKVSSLSAPPPVSSMPERRPVVEGEGEEGSFLSWGLSSALDTVGLGRRDNRLEAPGIVRSHQSGNYWMSSPIKSSPIAMAVGDLTGDGHNEIVLAYRDELQIVRLVEGQLKEMYQLPFSRGTQLLSVDTYDLIGNGRDEILLTMVTGTTLNSRALSVDSGHLRTITSDIDWFLRVTQLSSEGPVLLGQRIHDIDGTFRAPVFRVTFDNDRLVRGQDLDLPFGVNLYNFMMLDEPENNPYLVVLSDADYLHLMTTQGEALWSSTDHLGGTSASYSVLPRREAQEREPQFLQKRILRLPTGEIVTIQNEGQRILTGLRLFTNSRLVAFGVDDYRLKELWTTSTQKGYLADFAVADIDGDGTIELILAMRFQEKNILQRGHSALMVFKLQQ